MAQISSASTGDTSPGDSIVEHPFCVGESPQWRHMTRTPDKDDLEKDDEESVHDQETQTIEMDAQFQQKSRALDELEEDIDEAKARLAALQEERDRVPTSVPDYVLQQLEYQRYSMDALRNEMAALRSMMAQVLQTVQSNGN
ncbi:Hypothetical protein, putative [Bodo saltans]|uniref:Uncharacterized protein n=1 Tax=Bodo saltans TaxID=75058 RepID=A0A0S4JSE3_BODSA|nr:Hypothetical protein, putative [Bodo saltans]|eukprot:CUG92249.1 Hypothetical protein, putative [Bodo saltans]